MSAYPLPPRRNSTHGAVWRNGAFFQGESPRPSGRARDRECDARTELYRKVPCCRGTACDISSGVIRKLRLPPHGLAARSRADKTLRDSAEREAALRSTAASAAT